MPLPPRPDSFPRVHQGHTYNTLGSSPRATICCNGQLLWFLLANGVRNSTVVGWTCMFHPIEPWAGTRAGTLASSIQPTHAVSLVTFPDTLVSARPPSGPPPCSGDRVPQLACTTAAPSQRFLPRWPIAAGSSHPRSPCETTITLVEETGKKALQSSVNVSTVFHLHRAQCLLNRCADGFKFDQTCKHLSVHLPSHLAIALHRPSLHHARVPLVSAPVR